jgi:hypothetical protein
MIRRGYKNCDAKLLIIFYSLIWEAQHFQRAAKQVSK